MAWRECRPWVAGVWLAFVWIGVGGSVAQPELRFQGFSVSPEYSVLGTQLTASFLARNDGGEAAEGFYVDLWEHRDTAPTDRTGADATWRVPRLSGGGTLTASHSFTPGSTGLYRAWAWVDSANEVAEGIEYNNKISNAYVVNEEGQLPDLNLYFWRVIPRYSALGEELTWRVAVRNDGDGHAGTFRIDFWKCLFITPVVPATGDAGTIVWGLPSGEVAQWESTFTPTAPGDCWAWAWADSYDQVPETTEANNKRRDTYAVNLPAQQPDLVVDAFGAEPDASLLGTQVTLSATIRNAGPGHAALFTISFWEHRAAEPPDASDRDASSFVPSLGAYVSVDREHSFTPSASGVYNAWVWADSNGDVPESNEGNNKASDLYAVVDAPDLIIDALALTPDPPLLGIELTLTVTERNIGTAAASQHSLAAWRHRATAPSVTSAGDYAWQIPTGLAPGATATRAANFTPGFPGDRIAWAYADSGGLVGEMREDNNTASHPYTIGDNPDLPELRFTELLVWPQNSALGEELEGQVHFHNAGNMPTGPFRIAFWRHRAAPPVLGTNGDVNWDIPDLGPDAYASRRTTYTPNYPGTRHAWAVLDSQKQVLESNERNNIRGFQYRIGRTPDLTVLSLSVTPNPSALGQELTAEVEVRNVGDADAGAFRIALWRHRPWAPVIPVNGEVNWDIAGLPAAAVVARSTAFTPNYPGARTAWAAADAQQAVGETSESNNVRSCPYSISGEALPDLIASSFAVTPNPSDLGTELRYAVVVENLGAVGAGAFDVDLWYHRTTPPIVGSAGRNHRWNFAGLGPAEMAAVAEDFYTPSYPGDRTARVLVDAQGAVPESNETNNTAAAAYHITPPASPAGTGGRRPVLE